MICACSVGFYACAIPTLPKYSWNVFLFMNVFLFTCNICISVREHGNMDLWGH